ncbi:deaminase [Streptomyces sp. SBT349]|uniref:deaminase n=1 Tax=Streptomyces sp. SBT349 TaxID=1580539 RepID=UPI000B305E40|nr:deaminase [Streptomyces sp. SBT349]
MTGTGSTDDRRWMRYAIDLSHACPPSRSAFSVGAVIVADGRPLAAGYSRETDEHVHAEESALSKVAADDPQLPRATLYSTLEPCTQRRSRPHTCSELILQSGIPRVVIAWREPSLFVTNCVGVAMLRANGIAVTELPDLAEEARAVNTHLPLATGGTGD